MGTTVVVTGDKGFVAHHTLPLLREAGYDVVGFDLQDGLDICDPAALRRVLKPGCKVLHLAACSRFSLADADPPNAYKVNVGGTGLLLEVAHEMGVERVVMASTGSVYMPVWRVPIDERHPASGNSHYAFSKLWGERMTLLYRTPFVVLRYAHIYGAKRWKDGLINAFIDRVRRGMQPILYGGQQSNDFTYVKDIARANVLALETPHLNEVYNIGTGNEITSKDASLMVAHAIHYEGKIDVQARRDIDPPRFVYDIDKARRLLGYEPKWAFEAGLEDMLCDRARDGEEASL